MLFAAIQRFIIMTRLKLLPFLFLLLPFLGFGQFYNGSQVEFGKNRVQYNDFLWNYFRYNNLDVYFYLNGRELAEHTAEYARNYIPVIERKLETTFDEKLQFIVFNSLGDLKQSNLGLMNQMQYNTGGITHIIGNKVFIYFDGDINHFDRQIRAGLARVLLEKIIYGESIGAQIKNTTLQSIPKWYIDGLVAYYSRPWDTECDNIVKDGILSEKYSNFNHLTGEDAVNAGHSIWRFIAQKYGEQNISNIVYMSRLNRNVESGFLYVLGISFDDLVKDWSAYFKNYYSDAENNSSSDFGTAPSVKIKSGRIYNNLRLSPDGSKMVYTVNDAGLYKVMLYDLSTQKQKRIFKKGVRLDEKVDYSYPLLAWHPTGNVLSMINESKGLLFLYMYDMETLKWTQINLFGFQKILDFAYSPDGRSLVLSGVQRGQSDIYLYNISSNSYTQLTKDPYNDLNPRFLPGTNKIVFSSNRADDSLRLDIKKPEWLPGAETNDLFTLDIKNNKNLYRVTRTPLANETSPRAFSNNRFSYLSDGNGIVNIYNARFDSAIAWVDTTVHYRYFAKTAPATNYSRNVMDFDVNANTGDLAKVIFKKSKYSIYLGNYNSESAQINIAETQFMKAQSDALIAEEAAKKATGKVAEPKTRKKQFVNVYQNTAAKDTISGKGLANDNALQLKGNSLWQNAGDNRFGAKSPLPPKQRNYNVEYSINTLISQLDFSYLNLSYQPFLGSAGPIFQNAAQNALLYTGATDLLEDYRIIAGVRINYTSLENNEYLLGFVNYKQQLDREIYFHRSSYDLGYMVSNSPLYVKHRVHELHYVLRYPFSEVLALKTSAMLQNDKAIVLITDLNSAQYKGYNDFWGSLKVDLTFDNTRELGKNLYQGMRYKIFGEYYRLIGKNATHMEVVGFDVRHYTRIHRNFIWANRLAGSTSFGKSKLLYYMGGVDNWLLPKFNFNNQIDLEENYAFQTLATNMRGFSQNIRNGNTFALWSTELRFPIISYLYQRPLRSEFLQNFQIVGFADVGSAWKGLNPLSEENTYFTTIVYQKPLYVTVKVQKDPLVAGYGFGFRSSLFGYFIRADWAWGIEEREIQKRIFYLSLNLDF